MADTSLIARLESLRDRLDHSDVLITEAVDAIKDLEGRIAFLHAMSKPRPYVGIARAIETHLPDGSIRIDLPGAGYLHNGGKN